MERTYRAVDVVVFPFTPDTKPTTYENATVLKNSLLHLGIWDSEFSADQLVADMDAAGVEAALVCAQQGGSWEVSYEYIAGFTSAHPGRLYGTAGIDPRDIRGGVEKLEAAIRDLKFVGAHSYPHWFGLSPADRTYYPFYMKCIELDVPVQIQVGQAFQAGLRNVGTPAAIDEIAVDFPDLKIVGIHTGYPWVTEMVAVTWKHPNVYLGADCHHPRDWPDELVEFIKGRGRDKVLWGTNKPVIEMADSLSGVDALGLDAETSEDLLYRNLDRVYRLSEATATQR